MRRAEVLAKFKEGARVVTTEPRQKGVVVEVEESGVVLIAVDPQDREPGDVDGLVEVEPVPHHLHGEVRIGGDRPPL